MSDAGYGFLSLVRRGLAARIPATVPPADARVAVSASFSVAGEAATGLPALALRGPGDIIGFDGRAISRTWPTANDQTAEPNYFALAEVRDADLPWRYSPEPTSGDRLTPWLCLIVVADSEIAPLVSATRDRPLAALTVNDAGALPDLTQAWAWAHAQIIGSPTAPATDFDAATVASLLASAPQLLSARLLCPRKLDPQTQYLACIVPTFERGRLAGLGQPVDHVDRSTPAWTGAAPVTLPVYYSWRFQTGQPGDFASLARLLVPRATLPSRVWERDLAVSAPGVSPPAWQVVGLQGALRTLDATPPPWSALDTQGFTAKLLPLVNGTSRTVLGPPLYGRWLAAASSLSTAAGAAPTWFHQLNGDPRARVAAGLGTLVVQSQQQDLLAGAWAQLDGIRAVNRRLRLTQLARELATRLHDRHFSVPGDAFVQLTQPLHGHVRAGTTTARAQLDASPIGTGPVGAAWRRLSRPFGSLGLRQNRPALPVPASGTSALARLNSGALALLPARATVSATGAAARLGDLASTFTNAKVAPEKIGTVALAGDFKLQLIAREAFVPPAALASATTTPPITTPAPREALATDTRTLTTLPGTTAVGVTTVATTTTTTATAADGAAFSAAVSVLMQQMATSLTAGTQWVSANLPSLSQTIAATLHPKQTIEGALAAQLSGVPAGSTRTDPIEPVLAAPDFPQPMYAPLGAQSQSWLIPGLDQVPANSVATLMTNWPFVESYLVGLNHELARKLLWNGFPTDQRGTYFRHFWDIRSRTDGSTDGDIGPITRWTADLGKNRPRASDPLVLLVRGELIRRYPNVIVYAVQGVAQNGTRQPGTTELQPLFFARLDPDVALFGFDLDPTAARANPGWYFVLQEHPSEPRFGLAVPGTAFGAQPASWDVLGWDHLAANATALSSLRYIDLGASLPQNPSAADPSGAVWHAGGTPGSRAADLAHLTFRRPQRLAIHASLLIPTGSPT